MNPNQTSFAADVERSNLLTYMNEFPQLALHMTSIKNRYLAEKNPDDHGSRPDKGELGFPAILAGATFGCLEDSARQFRPNLLPLVRKHLLTCDRAASSDFNRCAVANWDWTDLIGPPAYIGWVGIDSFGQRSQATALLIKVFAKFHSHILADG